MSSFEYLRQFVNERLKAAAEEIFRVFNQTIVEYEEEIDRQRKLLDVVWKPELKLHRIELPQQHVCTEEEVLAGRQLWNQEDSEPPQIKEEQEEVCTSQEGELVLKQEIEIFTLTSTYEDSNHQLLSYDSQVAEGQDQTRCRPTLSERLIPAYEESDHSEDETLNISIDETQRSEQNRDSVIEEKPLSYISDESSVASESNSDHQLLSHNAHVAESQNQNRGNDGDSESSRNAEAKQKKSHHKSKGHSKNVYNPNFPEVHSHIHTNKKSFTCDICGYTFKYKSLLYRHMSVHSGEKPYPCNTCGKRFGQKSTLKTHIQIHTGEKPYPCNSCGKRFNRTSALNAHTRIHTGEKPYSCKTCGKDFRFNGGLIIHMRTHTGEMPFTCNTCGKDFRASGHLKCHMRTHTGERPHKCNTCGKRFCGLYELSRHMRLHTGK